MNLVIAEKPSVAQSIAFVIGATNRKDGYMEGSGYLVSWCVGHLVELASADAYDEKYAKWTYHDLPILPASWQYSVANGKEKQLKILRELMSRPDVDTVTAATDAGREGELIFRLVYNHCNCKNRLKGFGFLQWRKVPLPKGLKTSKMVRNMNGFISQLYAVPKPTGLLASMPPVCFPCCIIRP